MTKLILPLALAFAASTALACPAGMKGSDAKADMSPSLTAALSAKTDKAAVAADKKAVKPVDAKKPTS
jgi:hypothetical protein